MMLYPGDLFRRPHPSWPGCMQLLRIESVQKDGSFFARDVNDPGAEWWFMAGSADKWQVVEEATR